MHRQNQPFLFLEKGKAADASHKPAEDTAALALPAAPLPVRPLDEVLKTGLTSAEVNQRVAMGQVNVTIKGPENDEADCPVARSLTYPGISCSGSHFS